MNALASPAPPPRQVLLPDAHLSTTFRALLRQRCQEGRLGLVGDLNALEQRYRAAALAAAAHDVDLLYAVKASTHPEVLRRAAQFGLGFDIANACELEHARAASPLAPLSLTSAALPLDQREPLYRAFREGRVQRWHCDSLRQLAELARRCPGSTVGVRLNLDGLDIPNGMPVYRPSRFGIRVDQLPLAMEVAAAHGCTVRWLHIHNGSEVNDTASYAFAGEQILAAARAHGMDIESLDLGGGLLLEPTPRAIGEFFATIRKAVGSDVRLIFEPGRFWLTDCIALITQVLDVKETSAQISLVLDLGTLSHLQWSDCLRIPALGEFIPGDPRPWRICGRTCFEEDMLDECEPVPVVPGGVIPEVADCFVLGNVSGYSIELGCDFNGVAPPAVDFVSC
jgi:diaminopimelate decarboxylase